MASRGRKANEFTDFLSGMNKEKLYQLIVEAQAAIRLLEREDSVNKKKEQAIVKRDALKIGKPAYFLFKKEVVSGIVTNIGVDQIRIEGSKKGWPILNLISAKEAKKLTEENDQDSENADTEKSTDDTPEETGK